MEELAEAVRQTQHKLAAHVQANETQFAQIESRLSDLSTLNKETIMSEMPEVKITNNPGDQTAALLALAGNRGNDGGFGGNGIMGLVALMALLNRGGLGGLGSGDGGAAVNQITLGQIQTALGDIKASVPLAESQVQLALAGAQSDITQQTQAQTLALTNQNTQAMLANVQGFANTGDKIDRVSTDQAVGFGVINSNLERVGWQLSQTVKDDGEKTRALITTNQLADLNRLAAERQDEIIELRANNARDRDRHGIEITMNNTQNQNQMQFQQQAQVLTQLTAALCEIGQLARATNTNLIVGNSGATTTGAQTANPVNVRA